MCFLQKLARDASDEDCFFDLLSKFQSSRMDDQRCQLDESPNGENAEGADPNTLNDMIGQSHHLSDAQEILLFLKGRDHTAITYSSHVISNTYDYG